MQFIARPHPMLYPQVYLLLCTMEPYTMMHVHPVKSGETESWDGGVHTHKTRTDVVCSLGPTRAPGTRHSMQHSPWPRGDSCGRGPVGVDGPCERQVGVKHGVAVPRRLHRQGGGGVEQAQAVRGGRRPLTGRVDAANGRTWGCGGRYTQPSRVNHEGYL